MVSNLFKIVNLKMQSFRNNVNAQVKSAYNKTIDFHKYRTYSFGGWENNGFKELNDLDKSRFLEAFKEEFALRNMTFVPESTDIVFKLLFVTEVATIRHVDNDLNIPQNVYNDKTGLGLVNELYRQDYVVGTVIVDFFDGETKEQVGQATMMKPLSKNEKKHEKNISKAAKTLMKKYPVDS